MRYNVVLKHLLLIFIAGVFTSCSSNNFNSIEEFRKSDNKVRIEFITQTLINHKIANYNQYIIKYIDYVLTSSDRYSVLSKQNQMGSFTEFINTAIPILYFSYSYQKYHLISQDLRPKVKNYLVNYIPYEFSYGEAKFREKISNSIDEKDLWYIYIFYNENEPDEYATGRLDNQSWFKAVACMIWSDDFNYGDFKLLSLEDQSSLLFLDVKLQLSLNDPNSTSDYREKVASIVRDKWLSKGEEAMNKAPFNQMSKDTPFHELPSVVINYFRKQH
jgi:hypothetical protein